MRLQREKLTAAFRQVHTDAKVYMDTLVKGAIKRHKVSDGLMSHTQTACDMERLKLMQGNRVDFMQAIHNSACRSIEEVALNKKSAEVLEL